MSEDVKSIATEILRNKIMEDQTATFRSENKLDEEETSALLNQVSNDKRYIKYCKTNVTPPECHKFKLMLAKMIIQENPLRNFQLENKLKDIEIKALIDIAKVDQRYLDFCKKNTNPFARKKYEVSLIKKIFAANPGILHNFCISSPSRRLSSRILPSRKL